MKQSLRFIVVFCSVAILWLGNYVYAIESTLDTNSECVAKYWNCHKFPNQYGTSPFALYCAGDTICDGVKYERLYFMNASVRPNEIGKELIWDWQNSEREKHKRHIGELRYSSDNNKMYVRQNGTEYLLFDFSAKEGDICRVYAGFDTVSQPKQTELEDNMIDLVVLKTYEKDGKRMIDLAEASHPNDAKYQTTWIEGVGSIYGLFPILIEDLPENIPASSLLSCAWCMNDNIGELLYHTPDEVFAFFAPSSIVINACEDIVALTTQYDEVLFLPEENQPMYNILGLRVDARYKGIVIQNGKKYVNL